MAKKNEEISLKRVFSNNVLMLRYIGKYTPGLIVWMLLLSLPRGLVTVLNATYLAKYVLDAFQKNMKFVDMLPFLMFGVGINVALAVLNSFYQETYLPRKQEVLYAKMHEELFAKSQEMELACYDNPKFYNDFVWAMSQADQKALEVLSMCGDFIQSLTAVTGLAAVIASIDYIGLIVAALVLVMEGFVQKKLVKLDYDESIERNPMQRKRDYTSRILYQPEYAKEIRLTKAKNVLIRNFSEANKKVVSIIRKYGFKKALLTTVLNAVLSSGMLYGVYSGYLLYGTLSLHLYSYGDFYAIFNGSLNFNSYWSKMIQFFNGVRKNALYIEKFRGFMEYVPQMADAEDATALPEKSEEINFEHVSFTYDGMIEPTLKDINLSIKPGEKIALVGYNGAGKTTLVKLLMRLYEVTDGEIKIGQKNIKEYKLSDYRKYFGVVFQDYQLLAATIGENVKMDIVKDDDEHQIIDALGKSGFGEKIRSISGGIKAMISREFDKNGILLSGGEGQKVAIARVFPRDCKVVVLDEPSSALDPISEYNVNQSMLEASKNKTVIFISHRLSTTRVADRIIMLENGQIIEQGSHEELMDLNGKYAEMFNMQSEKYNVSI